MKAKNKFKPGDRVICNGYIGTIIDIYDAGIYTVRLKSGDVCGFESELKRHREPTPQPYKP